MDTERPDEPDSTGEAYEPVDLDVSTDVDTFATEPAAPPLSRLLLALIAGLAVAAAGIAVWAQLYYWRNNNYVGVSVVFALVIGYVVREVSGRSDLLARILAALVTVAFCVVGFVSATAVGLVKTYGAEYWPEFKRMMKEPWTHIRPAPVLTLVILAAAVVVAFISAGPTKPKQPKQPKAAPAPAAEPTDPYES